MAKGIQARKGRRSLVVPSRRPGEVLGYARAKRSGVAAVAELAPYRLRIVPRRLVQRIARPSAAIILLSRSPMPTKVAYRWKRSKDPVGSAISSISAATLLERTTWRAYWTSKG